MRLLTPLPLRQIPLPPAGTIGLARGVGPYPRFPRSTIDRLRWALGAPITSPTAKVVLVIVAFHADRAGKAWPSLDTIAAEASLSRRSVVYALQRLVADGWLTAERRPRLTTRYRPKAPSDNPCLGCSVLLPAGIDLCPVCGLTTEVHQLRLGGVHEVHVGAQELHPKD